MDAEVVAICVDSVAQNKEVVDGNGFEFDILSDSEYSTIKEYGLLHEEGHGHDIGRPAIFILDRTQQIGWKFVPDNFRGRTDPQAIIDELKKIE